MPKKIAFLADSFFLYLKYNNLHFLATMNAIFFYVLPNHLNLKSDNAVGAASQ